MRRRRTCGDGRHGYVSAGEVGGGIRRWRCNHCGVVTIDLRDDLKAAVNEPGQDDDYVGATAGLFARRDRTNLFHLWASEAKSASEVSSTFGRPSGQRRR